MIRDIHPHLDRLVAPIRSFRIVLGCFLITLGTGALAAGWEPASMPFDGAQTRRIALAPSQPQTVYMSAVGIGLHRSDDRGTNWTSVNATLPLDRDFLALEVSPSDPDHLFAGEIGDYPDGPSQVYESTNGGTTWSLAGGAIDTRAVTDILLCADMPNVILAAASGGTAPGIYRSTDGGSSWVLASGLFGATTVGRLASNPSNSNEILVAYDDGIARSTDGGVTWAPTTTGANFADVSWSASDPNVICATVYYDGLMISEDGGASFSTLSTPTDWVQRVAIDPTDANDIYILGENTGQCIWDGSVLWKTTNRGSTWTQLWNPCLSNPQDLLIDPASPSRIYASMYSAFDGFWRSSNSAGSWSREMNGLLSYHSWFLDSDHNGTIYSVHPYRYVKSSDPAGSWSEYSVPFDIIDIDAFATNASMPGLILQSGTGLIEGDIGTPYAVRSTNFGNSWWPELEQGLPSGLADAPGLFVADHAADGTVYAFAYSRAYRSDDAHLSYTLVGTGPRIQAAVIDPADSQRLFGAQNIAPRVLLSEDGAATWVERSNGLPDASVVSLFMDPANTDRLVVVFDEIGTYESADGGLHWIQNISTNAEIEDADWDPETGYVYLATSGSGVVTEDPRVLADGLPSMDLRAIAYSPVHQTLLIGAPFVGVHYQELTDPASVDFESGESSLRLAVSPNPSRSGTLVTFSLEAREHVSVKVVDVSGRPVATLEEGSLQAGVHQLHWDGTGRGGRRVPAGIYFVDLVGERVGGNARIVVMR